VTLPTSGTTAAQKRVAFAPEDLAASIEYFAAGMRMLADEGDAIAVLFPSERSFSLGALICSAVKSIKARPLPVAHPLDFAAVAELCRREDVKAMVGFPQNVLAVTQCCRFEGAGIALSSVLLSADHVAAPLRTAIAAATGAEVFAHYGLTEAGYGLAVECPEHQGLHVRESDLIVEVVDPLSGDVAADGELGEVVVTTLNQRAMPMIRYRTGDLACIIPGQCRCGSALRRLGRLSARAGERLALQGVSFGMAELEERLFTLPGIVDFHAAAQPCETEGTPRAALALRIKLAVLPGCGTTGADALAALEQAEPFKGLIAQGALHVEAQVDEAYANRPYYPAKRTIVKATSGL
jgi:phenylacetate-coenzyme A ligase PaaK-like adenylate-forming protein